MTINRDTIRETVRLTPHQSGRYQWAKPGPPGTGCRLPIGAHARYCEPVGAIFVVASSPSGFGSVVEYFSHFASKSLVLCTRISFSFF